MNSDTSQVPGYAPAPAHCYEIAGAIRGSVAWKSFSIFKRLITDITACQHAAVRKKQK